MILVAFNLQLIDESNFDKVLQSLHTKTSPGHDGISVKLVKYLATALRQSLALIINQSLLSGILRVASQVIRVSLSIDNKSSGWDTAIS